MSNERDYDLQGSGGNASRTPAPVLNYAPRLPQNYRPRIALIGCGGITKQHLNAYKKGGLEVVALCDINQAAAEERREEFYPEAKVYEDYNDMLRQADADLVDVALHPEPRAGAIEAALHAGKHVLSQKPFMLDLDAAERLVELARAKKVKLAVNQNGRWSPYVRYVTQLIRGGHIGEVQSVNICIDWDHTWCAGTPFEKIHHLVLYDFAIHWFDMTRLYFREQRALKAFATAQRAPDQQMRSPMIAAATVAFENGAASLQFDAHSQGKAAEETLTVVGSEGSVRGRGKVCAIAELTVETAAGVACTRLEGGWFPDGFLGTMGELLCAIEENREPENAAAENIRSLELAFACIESSDTGKAVVPGAARSLGKSCKIVD